MQVGLRVKYPLFLSDFNQNFYLPDRFSKNSHLSNFMEIRPDGTELFREERDRGRRISGRAAMTKIEVAFADLRTRV